jgi:hypothetical protein
MPWNTSARSSICKGNCWAEEGNEDGLGRAKAKDIRMFAMSDNRYYVKCAISLQELG